MTQAKPTRREEPLAGLTVAVTRPSHQAHALSSRLRARGARVLEAPVIRIEEPTDREPLLRAAHRLASYHWVVLTSVNGVGRFADALREAGVGTESLTGARLAAIGPATAAAAEEALGARPDVVPADYRAEALVDAILREARGTGARPLEGVRVLLPRAAEAREVLPARLEEAGARVDELPAYRTVGDETGAARLGRALADGGLHWITFTSSSTVRCFRELTGGGTGEARVAVIGPITARTARSLGVRVDVVAEEYTMPGLVTALCEAVTGRWRRADGERERGEP